MLIVLEGIDRSGKGTHAKRLAERLGAALMKYPARHTPIGRLIDGWLHGTIELGQYVDGTFAKASWYNNALAGQALLLANKIEIEAGLRERLRMNGRVVSDRYTPSAFAYGAADGLDRDWLVESHRELIRPDLCILLDITAEESMARKGRPEDEAYDGDVGRLTRARDHYLDIAKHGTNVPGPWTVIDAMRPLDMVAADIDSTVSATFGVRYCA